MYVVRGGAFAVVGRGERSAEIAENAEPSPKKEPRTSTITDDDPFKKIPKTQKESVVIDEIGKMECFSPLFRKTVLDVLDMSNVVIGTISLGSDQFIKEIKDRSDVLVVEISEKSRDNLAKKWDKLLKQSIRDNPRVSRIGQCLSKLRT